MDTGYLQHGTAGTPMRTEVVAIKPAPWPRAGQWLARYEGRWRLVHMQQRRLYVVYRGARITVVIEGV